MWTHNKLTPETLIKRDVRRYLGLKGWYAFPIVQSIGSHRGIPDIIAIKDGRVLFVECKTPKGKLSPHQEEFQRNIEDKGGTYLVVRSAMELQEKGI